MTVQHLNTLLEKTSSYDKDERYMATNDLCTELQKDIKIDVTMERRICAAVLKQLDDQSNDVQGLAVKCLGILFKKVHEAQVGEICDKLCTLILDGKSELRDIYSIGLRTLISDVPEAMGKPVTQRLTSRLLSGIEQDKVLEVKLECLDNLTDLLKRFGREVDNEHPRIMDVTLRQLTHERAVVRKRANACIGAFAVVASDTLLNRLMESLLHQIESQRKGKDVQTLIQTIGTISRTVGYRLGKHLDKVVPLFLRFCDDSDDGEDEERKELQENCLAGFESVVLRCPREVASHLDSIIDVSLRFMAYDPNYTYGESDEEGMSVGDEEPEDEYDEEDYGGSDDDDTSWKVRRSALKVLSAVITSRPEMLKELYTKIASHLIGRFKEREENVRLDVVSCFTCLLKATLALQTRNKGSPLGMSAQTPGIMREESGRWAVSRSGVDDQVRREGEATVLLENLLPALIRASDKQLQGNSLKTKSAVLLMLRSLVHVLRGGLSTHLEVLMNDIKRCLQDKNQGLKLDALSLTHTILESHPPEVLNPYLPNLVPLITTCVEDEWYKIIAEALRVVGVVITIIRPIDNSSGMFKGDFDSASYVRPLYQAIFPRLEAHDIDQEIKECAITAIGIFVTHLGDHLTTELPQVLGLMMDKLKNEITRMPTLKALARIAHSPLRVDLSPILSAAVTELSQFLRQQSRPLKLTTLETLVAMVENYAGQMSSDLFGLVLREASNLIADSDLHLSHLALQLTVCVIKVSPESVATVSQFSMPNVLALAGSPLLQGYALRSTLSLLDELVKIGMEGLDFHSLIRSLEEVAQQQQQQQSGTIPKQVLGNLAVCMARISASAKPQDRDAFIARLVQNMRADVELTRHLALLCVGELGAQVDLSSIPNLQNIILENFGRDNEETKAAAAYALGHVAAGNMSNYLPLILQYLGNPERPQYLLLLSLKEVILTRSSEFTAHIDQVLPHLFRHAQSPEEGVRNMVSECLGTLSNIDPPKVIGALKDLGDKAGDNKPTLWTIATALKYSMSSSTKTGSAAPRYLKDRPELLLATLKNAIEINVDPATVTSEDLDVQRATLLMVNAAAHHQPGTIAPYLEDYVVKLLDKSMTLTLERKVNLGPFTHTVDDGLPLRKAAFSCLDTMLDSMPNLLALGPFMPRLSGGLGDKDDVQMLCHQILVKICRYSPGAVLGSLDSLLDPLEKDANKKVKDQQVGTEVERTNDLIRSSLRALVAVFKIDGASQNTKLVQLVERIQAKDHLRPVWASITAERGLEG